MAKLHNNEYDPKYPWRPQYAWDNCPGCFEHFDDNYMCNHCGLGHADYDCKRPEPAMSNE